MYAYICGNGDDDINSRLATRVFLHVWIYARRQNVTKFTYFFISLKLKVRNYFLIISIVSNFELTLPTFQGTKELFL